MPPSPLRLLERLLDRTLDRVTFYVMGHVDRRLAAVEARGDQLAASLDDTDRTARDALALAQEHAHQKADR